MEYQKRRIRGDWRRLQESFAEQVSVLRYHRCVSRAPPSNYFGYSLSLKFKELGVVVVVVVVELHEVFSDL